MLTGWWGVVLDASDSRKLARFYADLLGWELVNDGEAVHPGEGTSYIAFQTSPGYEPPTWPSAEGRQQMMLHVDVGVTGLDEEVARAVELGATVAGFQPQDDVRVMLDPAGHPFCLYLDAG
ncbi:VOC family protein [Herbidospora cretacea]|uniref:VOC family protein n=1 Tax=Herbidospora cretacea TaxID=28444 RepID=UPI0004C385F8|nr:VOC family protein [Herbidospora cretacea]